MVSSERRLLKVQTHLHCWPLSFNLSIGENIFQANYSGPYYVPFYHGSHLLSPCINTCGGAWVLSWPEFMQAGIFLEAHGSWVFRPGFITCPCHWPTNNKCIFEIVWVEIQGCTIEQTHSVPLGELQWSDSLNLDISSLYNLKNHRATRVGMDLRSQHWILGTELYSRREKPNQSGEADFRVTEHKAGDIKYQSGSPQCRLSLIQTRVWLCECLP